MNGKAENGHWISPKLVNVRQLPSSHYRRLCLLVTFFLDLWDSFFMFGMSPALNLSS